MSIAGTLKNMAKAGIKKADDLNKVRKAKATENIGKKALGGLFEKIDPKDATEMYEKISGYKLTKAAGIGGTIGVAGFAAANVGLKSYHSGKLGDVRGGELPNMVSSNISPNLNNKLEMLETENAEEAMENIQGSMNTTQYGVEPEIVFALHELRN